MPLVSGGSVNYCGIASGSSPGLAFLGGQWHPFKWDGSCVGAPPAPLPWYSLIFPLKYGEKWAFRGTALAVDLDPQAVPEVAQSWLSSIFIHLLFILEH